MAFYRAKVQSALLVHGDVATVVEAEVELPDFYQPAMGNWLDHPLLDGPTRILAVGYDAKIGRLVIALGAGARDPSMNLKEWLAEHPHWSVAKNPTLAVSKIDKDNPPANEDPSGDSSQGPFSAN